jgi:hypothetical protein
VRAYLMSLNRHFMEHGHWATELTFTYAVAGFNSYKMTLNLGLVRQECKCTFPKKQRQFILYR